MNALFIGGPKHGDRIDMDDRRLSYSVVAVDSDRMRPFWAGYIGDDFGPPSFDPVPTVRYELKRLGFLGRVFNVLADTRLGPRELDQMLVHALIRPEVLDCAR